MDQNERVRLKKQYEQYEDSQVLAMLEDGPEAFVAGAYALLEEEAQRRGISLNSEVAKADQKPAIIPTSSAAGDVIQPEAFVEIMVINHDADQQSVESRLEATDIQYHFMKISVAGKDLPLALMVDQQRIDEAIEQLKQLRFVGSILLW